MKGGSPAVRRRPRCVRHRASFSRDGVSEEKLECSHAGLKPKSAPSKPCSHFSVQPADWKHFEELKSGSNVTKRS